MTEMSRNYACNRHSFIDATKVTAEQQQHIDKFSKRSTWAVYDSCEIVFNCFVLWVEFRWDWMHNSVCLRIQFGLSIQSMVELALISYAQRSSRILESGLNKNITINFIDMLAFILSALLNTHSCGETKTAAFYFWFVCNFALNE